MLLGKVNDMGGLVYVLAQIVYVKVLALVNYKEFAHSTHESTVVRVNARAASFWVKVE